MKALVSLALAIRHQPEMSPQCLRSQGSADHNAAGSMPCCMQLLDYNILEQRLFLAAPCTRRHVYFASMLLHQSQVVTLAFFDAEL